MLRVFGYSKLSVRKLRTYSGFPDSIVQYWQEANDSTQRTAKMVKTAEKESIAWHSGLISNATAASGNFQSGCSPMNPLQIVR
jgi:hypothetical protein